MTTAEAIAKATMGFARSQDPEGPGRLFISISERVLYGRHNDEQLAESADFEDIHQGCIESG